MKLIEIQRRLGCTLNLAFQVQELITESCQPTSEIATRRNVACTDLVLRIGQLAIKSHRLAQRAEAHAEEAEACGYANDPTGSGHVSDSWQRASKAAGELALAIDEYMSKNNRITC